MFISMDPTRHIVCGGASFVNEAEWGRSARRLSVPTRDANSFDGLRIARSVGNKPKSNKVDEVRPSIRPRTTSRIQSSTRDFRGYPTRRMDGFVGLESWP